MEFYQWIGDSAQRNESLLCVGLDPRARSSWSPETTYSALTSASSMPPATWYAPTSPILPFMNRPVRRVSKPCAAPSNTSMTRLVYPSSWTPSEATSAQLLRPMPARPMKRGGRMLSRSTPTWAAIRWPLLPPMQIGAFSAVPHLQPGSDRPADPAQSQPPALRSRGRQSGGLGYRYGRRRHLSGSAGPRPSPGSSGLDPAARHWCTGRRR